MSSNAKAFKNMPPEQAQVTAAKPARVQVLKPVPAKEPMPGLSPQVQELIGEFESVCRRVPSLVNEFREALLRRHSLTDVPNQDEEMSDVLAPIVEDLIWTAVPDEWIESAKTRLLNEERRKCALPIQFVAAISGAFSEVAQHRPYVMRDLEKYKIELGVSYGTLLTAQLSFYIANKNVVPS